MRIAYLTSQYPAVSQTFITREVILMRALGFDIRTYSVRRADRDSCFDDSLTDEAKRTKWLLPPPLGELMRACLWTVVTRPIKTAQTFFDAAFSRDSRYAGRVKWLGYYVEAILLAYWLVRDKIDHLHCHIGNSGSSTGMLAATLSGLPFSVTCHGSELREIKKHRLAEKVRRAAFVACVSQFGRAQLMLACEAEQWEKLLIVRCGVLHVELPNTTGEILNSGPAEILCVARLSKEKGHLVLLDALAKLRKQKLSFHCTLVGDGPMRCQIDRHCAKLELEPFVTMTGFVPPEQMGRYYLSANIVVLASFSEGVPVVLMEGMEYRKPVIGTLVGGTAELIEHGRSGLLVPPGDGLALAAALRRVIENPVPVARMVEAAHRHVRSEFDVTHSANLLAKAFHLAQE